jgi:3-hydroxyacyl-[acyl-carrier-protein] dehydratase
VKAFLEAREIQEILGHRYPFLFVDRILEMEEGKRVVGLKNFTMNEPYVPGHFPGNPIVPGVVLLEAMAQVGAICVLRSDPAYQDKLLYLAGMDKVRFRRPVLPGDQVIFELDLIGRKRGIWKVKGLARVDGKLVMEAVLLAIVSENADAAGGRR